MAEMITLAAWARHRGFSRQRADELYRAGRLTVHVVGGRLMLDPEQADLEFEATSNPLHPQRVDNRRGRPARRDGTEGPLAEAKRRKLRAQVALLEDELRALRRKLITPEDVAELHRAEVGLIVGKLCAYARATAPRAAGRPAGEAAEIVQTALYATMQRLADAEVVGTKPDPPEPEPADLAAMSLAELTRHKLDIEAELLELERYIATGALLRTDDVLAEQQPRYMNTRSRLLAIPHRAAPNLEFTPDTAEAERLLLREVVEAVEELAGFGVDPRDHVPPWARKRLGAARSDGRRRGANGRARH